MISFSVVTSLPAYDSISLLPVIRSVVKAPDTGQQSKQRCHLIRGKDVINSSLLFLLDNDNLVRSLIKTMPPLPSDTVLVRDEKTDSIW
jgi:hypothetical protein